MGMRRINLTAQKARKCRLQQSFPKMLKTFFRIRNAGYLIIFFWKKKYGKRSGQRKISFFTTMGSIWNALLFLRSILVNWNSYFLILQDHLFQIPNLEVQNWISFDRRLPILELQELREFFEISVKFAPQIFCIFY